MDVEIASEFTAMASHLMLIKTKMLLSAAEQEEAMSEMELLIQSLEQRQRKDAYEKIRAAASFLAQRNEFGLGLFTKGPEPLQRITHTDTATTGRICSRRWRPSRSARHGCFRRRRQISAASSARSRIR